MKEELNDPRIQAMFKRSRHNIFSVFIISQDCHELPKRTIRANGNIHLISKPNKYREVLNIYQDEKSMDMTFNKFRLLTSTCWNEKYQPLTIDVTKDKYTGRYRLGLYSLFIPTSHFFIN